MNNRIIKFRAINNSGNILIGDLIQFGDIDKHFIIPNNLFFCDVIIGIDIEKRLPIIDLKFEVLKDTIGQFTGLTDKNGVEIFEGDILKQIDKYGKIICTIKRNVNNMNFCAYSKRLGTLNFDFISNFEVIGNIYQNKELLND